jgi:hypothetical protein
MLKHILFYTSFALILLLEACVSKPSPSTQAPNLPNDQNAIIDQPPISQLDSYAGDSTDQSTIKRKVIKLANILPLATKPGTAAVRICIDRSGKVVRATYDYESSSFKSEKYAKRVEECTKNYEFEANPHAPEEECGNLKLIFKGGRSLRYTF